MDCAPYIKDEFLMTSYPSTATDQPSMVLLSSGNPPYKAPLAIAQNPLKDYRDEIRATNSRVTGVTCMFVTTLLPTKHNTSA